MKKLGFTLAEILIVLGIIGVISALTLPTFVNNTRNQSMASKLSTTVNALENAISSMLAAEATNDITETEFYKALEEEDWATAGVKFGDYYKIDSAGETLADMGYNSNSPFVQFNSKTTFPYTLFDKFNCKSKGGAVIGFLNNSGWNNEDLLELGSSITSLKLRIYIDVNGPEKPNMANRDLFIFGVSTAGVFVPDGSLAFNANSYGSLADWREEDISSCTDTKKSYCGCTARLVENGYKVDY